MCEKQELEGTEVREGAWSPRVKRSPGPASYPSSCPSRHNDLPWRLLTRFNNQLRKKNASLTSLEGTHTNIPKLKAGFVGGQVPSG